MDHLFSAATHSSLEVLPGFGGPGLRAHGEAADRGGGGEQPPANAQGLDQRDDMQLEKAGVDHHFVLAATSQVHPAVGELGSGDDCSRRRN